MRNIRVLFSMLVVLVLFSCDQDGIFDGYQTVTEGWGMDQPVVFEIADLDSLETFDMFITLRNNHEYPYSNLFVITSFNYPNGKRETDTLEYEMTRPDGSWLGTGSGEIKESKLGYKKGIQFRESGTYTFTVEHAMRKNGNVSGDLRLKGITEVGMRIERPEE